jgi:hypothetical protein
VIRWQFSLVGLGADLGIDGGWGEPPLYVAADKTELIRALFVDGTRPSAISDAELIIIDPLANVKEVADAVAALNTSRNAYRITAPAGATVKVYRQVSNYNLAVLSLLDTVENEDGSVTSWFATGAGTKHFRVSMPGKITKAGYFTSPTSFDTTVTFAEDEDPAWRGNTSTGKATSDDANTLLNIAPTDNSEGRGHNVLNLANVGDTFKLRSFRAAWQIIDSDVNNQMIEPDYNYNILSGSDVISITPDENIPNWAMVSALKDGVAVVEVSYDAIDIGGGTTSASIKGRYGATTPNLKALVVVTVGADNGTGADMTIAGKAKWDSEFDIFYTLKDADRMAVSTTDGAIITAWNPGAGKSEMRASDGMVTVYPGSNIIKSVNVDGVVTYKVVRVAKLTPVFTPAKPEIGEAFTVKLDGLVMGVPKMSGIYNPNFNNTKLHMDGTNADASGGQFTFSHLTVLAGTYTSEDQTIGGGYISSSHFGSGLGAHRNITDVGVGVNMSAPILTTQISTFPVIKLSDYFEDAVVEPDVDYEDALEAVLPYVKSTVTNPIVGSVGGEWAVLGSARSGSITDAQKDAYLANLKTYIENGSAYSVDSDSGKVVMHRVKYTDNSRVILALTALGIDASAAQLGDKTYDFVSALKDLDKVSYQGTNGDIFALIALGSHDYLADDPAHDYYLNRILNLELSGGGWAISGTVFDFDVSAMAIQALAPYYDSNPDVKAAVDRALDRLIWRSVADSEGASQMIVALSALGFDAANYESKNYINILISYRDESTGGFRHTSNGDVNLMATEQAAYALVAYDRYINDKNSLYNMSDVTLKKPVDNSTDIPTDKPTDNSNSNTGEKPTNNGNKPIGRNISSALTSVRIYRGIPANAPEGSQESISGDSSLSTQNVIDEAPTPRSSGADEKPVILDSSQNPNGDLDSGGFPIKPIIGAVSGLIALALISWLVIRGRGKGKHTKAA